MSRTVRDHGKAARKNNGLSFLLRMTGDRGASQTRPDVTGQWKTCCADPDRHLRDKRPWVQKFPLRLATATLLIPPMVRSIDPVDGTADRPSHWTGPFRIHLAGANRPGVWLRRLQMIHARFAILASASGGPWRGNHIRTEAELYTKHVEARCLQKGMSIEFRSRGEELPNYPETGACG